MGNSSERPDTDHLMQWEVRVGADKKKSAAKNGGACDTAGAAEGRKLKMAKSRLTNAAKKIGAAMGKADRTAHKVAKAGVLAKSELKDISKQVEALKKQLMKTTKKLQKALS
jgi:seryl-tRNA synthetase